MEVNCMYPGWTRENCQNDWKNPLLFQFIGKLIKWTVIIFEKVIKAAVVEEEERI